jgi:DNA-binding transcriptional LysR family regulator
VIRPEDHRIEIRHLRYFVAIAEHGGFRRAAERLHISQPPLSQQMAQLEERVGTPLLTRSPRGVALTLAGEAFLRDARHLLADLDRAIETARKAGAGQTGLVRVGFVGSTAYPTVPDVVRAFRATHPNVEIRLRELSTATQAEALLAGSLDIGFVRAPLDDEGLDVHVIHREPVLAAIPDSHPLAHATAVDLGALAAQPLIMFPRTQAPRFFDLLMDSLAATGTAPYIVQEAVEMQTIIGLVASGLGLSLVPAAVSALAREHVVYLPIAGGPQADLAIVRKHGPAEPATVAFLDAARRLRSD